MTDETSASDQVADSAAPAPTRQSFEQLSKLTASEMRRGEWGGHEPVKGCEALLGAWNRLDRGTLNMLASVRYGGRRDLALNLALSVAQAGERVLYCAREAVIKPLSERLLGVVANLDMDSLRRRPPRRVEEEEEDFFRLMHRLTGALEDVDGLALDFEAIGPPTRELTSLLHRPDSERPNLLIIDDLAELSAGLSESEVESLIPQMNGLARRFGTAILILNRGTNLPQEDGEERREIELTCPFKSFAHLDKLFIVCPETVGSGIHPWSLYRLKVVDGEHLAGLQSSNRFTYGEWGGALYFNRRTMRVRCASDPVIEAEKLEMSPLEFDLTEGCSRLLDQVKCGGYKGRSSGSFSTGDPALDANLGGGFIPSELLVLRGACKSGKSALARQFAFTASLQGPVLILSTQPEEVTQQQLLSELLDTDLGQLCDPPEGYSARLLRLLRSSDGAILLKGRQLLYRSIQHFELNEVIETIEEVQRLLGPHGNELLMVVIDDWLPFRDPKCLRSGEGDATVKAVEALRATLLYHDTVVMITQGPSESDWLDYDSRCDLYPDEDFLTTLCDRMLELDYEDEGYEGDRESKPKRMLLRLRKGDLSAAKQPLSLVRGEGGGFRHRFT